MSWTVVWTDQASRDLRALDAPNSARILRTVRRFVETEHGDIAQIQGEPGVLRLRVGDWRVRFTFDETRTTVTILRVLHRREAYRDR